MGIGKREPSRYGNWKERERERDRERERERERERKTERERETERKRETEIEIPEIMFVDLGTVTYTFVRSSLLQEQILIFCSINWMMSLFQNAGIEINLI